MACALARPFRSLVRPSPLPSLGPTYSARSLHCTPRRARPDASTPSQLYPGLYYHPHPSLPHAFTLSYLPSPPPSLAFSPTTIGTLRTFPSSKPSSFDQPSPPADADLPPITPRTFADNPDWLRLVHDILREHVEGDLWLQTQAKALHDDTHLHIADERAPADTNRVPSPQDILASVLVQDGKLVGASYEPNRVAYRVVTEDGLMRLPQALLDRVKKACVKVREVEEEVAREQRQ
ncbi:hypothetical protein JCM10449v2_003550 [Rhodotorula kratochvilovae]